MAFLQTDVDLCTNEAQNCQYIFTEREKDRDTDRERERGGYLQQLLNILASMDDML